MRIGGGRFDGESWRGGSIGEDHVKALGCGQPRRTAVDDGYREIVRPRRSAPRSPSDNAICIDSGVRGRVQKAVGEGLNGKIRIACAGCQSKCRGGKDCLVGNRRKDWPSVRDLEGEVCALETYLNNGI